MAAAPLMPKATAVWLVDNTALTFRQIADFCQLHELEVKGIADGDVAMGIKGMDPITSGQLTRDELEKAQEDPGHRLAIAESKVEIPVVKSKKGPRYTPVSRRQDRPDAIDWLLRKHPELTDAQIIKLVGTTKPTIAAIREHTHWNSPNIQPRDPVTLGLCSQIDLDGAVRKAAERLEKERIKAEKEAAKLGTLMPAEDTTNEGEATEATATAEEIGAAMAAAVSMTPVGDEAPEPQAEVQEAVEPPVDEVINPEDVFGSTPSAEPEKDDEAPDPDSVFAKLAELKKGMSDDDN
ncbi:MAG: cell cycle transcriptional regulator TrcR [Pseudomonadota bacterium]